MSLIAVCTDAMPPAVGDAFSSCTTVVWQELPSFLPELTAEGGARIAVSIGLLWALCWIGTLFYRVIQQR